MLSWPCEAMRDPEANYLSHTCQIERRLDKVRDPLPIWQETYNYVEKISDWLIFLILSILFLSGCGEYLQSEYTYE